MPEPTPNTTPEPRPNGQGTEPSTPKPWRTEGLPPPPSKEGKPRWSLFALAAIGYAVVFAILTVQDRLSAPQVVPYTEFRQQVVGRNVAEVFSRGDSIQGVLKKAVPVPGEAGATYDRFTTERPTFANDDLLAELSEGGAQVRATPLVQERGVLTNLLISVAPFLLLIGFYVWMFRRQQSMFGGGIPTAWLVYRGRSS